MKPIIFREVSAKKGYWAVMSILGAFVLMGAVSFFYMEHHGHWVSGMNNQVVWGMPHVFAIFLIVAASGALNIASISSVFDRKIYKPLSRMSAFLAISLLAGGLAVLVLDLGRPDRLIVAMTQYNFKSIFAWNVMLYTGFFAIVLGYVWTMMDPPMNRFSKAAGTFAFLWRLTLTTGTGSIFGFIVARQAFDVALMAPMFVVMSFAFGQAIFMILLFGIFRACDREIMPELTDRLQRLFGVLIAAVLYFTIVLHVTNLYATEHHGIEAFILRDGGIYTALFWFGQILVGAVIPLILVYVPQFKANIKTLLVASLMVIIGGISHIYVLLIGGQAFPLVLFPGKEVSSSFSDGVVNTYAPSLPEIMLGLGGFALAITLFMVASKALRIVPDNLHDVYGEKNS
jgi:Ni/Fe-hydrogenase subunit HybB-like protein